MPGLSEQPGREMHEARRLCRRTHGAAPAGNQDDARDEARVGSCWIPAEAARGTRPVSGYPGPHIEFYHPGHDGKRTLHAAAYPDLCAAQPPGSCAVSGFSCTQNWQCLHVYFRTRLFVPFMPHSCACGGWQGGSAVAMGCEGRGTVAGVPGGAPPLTRRTAAALLHS